MLRLTSDCTAGAMRMACGRIHLSWRGSTSKRSDKELAAVGVGAGVGHRERERAIVPEVAVEFVLELAAPANRFAQSRSTAASAHHISYMPICRSGRNRTAVAAALVRCGCGRSKRYGRPWEGQGLRPHQMDWPPEPSPTGSPVCADSRRVTQSARNCTL
jgi:hypothetical protein